MKQILGCRGMATERLIMSLLAIFVLTIIFLSFDPAIQTIHDDMEDMAPTRGVELGNYLNAWRWWVPMFLGAILVYMFTASTARPNKYGGGI